MALLSKRSPSQQAWVMLTAYDANMARTVEAGGADLILVGDSLGRAALGYKSENEVSLDDMIHHAKAVLRARQNIPVIVDLPYQTYDLPDQALASAQKVLGTGADFVKLEGPLFDVIEHLSQKNIPVIAHLGYTPQTADPQQSKVKGNRLDSADQLLKECLGVERAGAKMLVIEMVPREVAATIAQRLSIPVIGIGSGPDVDGQVLVTPDMWGENKAPFKFLEAFGDVGSAMREACSAYATAVRSKEYPEDRHSFHIKKDEKDAWLRLHHP
jgi:3-methyl-2-oxobutanoate hydroxymethyltransferase